MGIPKAVLPKTTKKKKTLLSPYDEKKIQEHYKERLSFSFCFFDRTREEFNCGGAESSWFIGLMDRLRDLSQLTISQFKDPATQERLRIHNHSWELVQDKLNLSEQWINQYAEDGRFYQISISKAKGRIHGFMIENTFFIVWLDPDHNLYPMKRHGGLKIFEPAKSEVEILEERLKECEEKYSRLEKEFYEYLEKATDPSS